MADSEKLNSRGGLDAAHAACSSQTASRRQAILRGMLAMGAGVTAMGWAPAAEKEARSTASGSPRGLLVRHTGLSHLNTRSKIVLELDGELRLKEPDPKKADVLRRAEVKAESTLDYFEQIAFADSKLVATNRRYVEAGVKNWISGSASSLKLRPVCAETLMMLHDGVWQQYCPREPLDARETELLTSPVNSASLELLLPKEPAKPDSQWTIAEDDAAVVFNLAAVHKSTLQAKIANVAAGVATIELEGTLEAAANGVPTTLKIQGNLHAKFGSQCAIVTWLGLSIREEREISQAEPGFAITARVRLIRTETEEPFEMTADALRGVVTKDEPGRWLVRLQSTAGRYSMIGDRRWRTYLDTGEEAILRLVENNMVIAQCNITRLPKLEDGSQLTLEGMQDDIRKSLGESFTEFQTSEEKLTSSNLRLIRSVVSGMAEDVPIQWVYNHLSDDQGHRFAMIFTMGGNVTDKFAAADEQMTANFELLPDATESNQAPTPASALSASSASSASEKAAKTLK